MGRAKETAKLTNRSNTRGYNQSMKEFAAQKADLEREVELTNLQQEKQFEYEQEIRNIQRLSALDQYEQNQQQYKNQLIFNEQAANAAVDSQNRVYESRLGEVEDQAEDQYIAYNQTQRNARYNLEQAEFSLDQAVYGAQSDLARVNVNRKQNELEYQNTIAGLQIDKQRSELQLNNALNNAANDRETSDIALTQALNSSKSAKAQSQLNYKNQLVSIGAEESNIQRAQEQATIRQINLDNQERDAVADRNFESLAAQIEDVMNSGSARSTGRTGNSAANTVQSTIATFAINTAKIEDALYRSKASINNERRDVASQMAALSRQTALLSNKKGNAFEGLQLALKDANDAKNIAGRKYGAEQGAIGDSITAAQRSASIDKSQIQIGEKTAAESKNLADESSVISETDATKKKEFAQRSAYLNTRSIEENLQADREVFYLSQKRLGESIVNAAAARDIAMSDIARSKVQADRQTDAARMLPPRFAPDPPKPYKAEMPTLVPPPEPIQVTREAYQVPQPKKQSGTSKVLSIGAAVLGVGAAVFTAGASLGPALGATTGLFSAAGNAAAIGTGLGAASSALGTIGKITY